MKLTIVLSYLEKLNNNNNREWFNENKSLYVGAKEEFELFINKLIPQIKSFDNSITALTAKDCVFRIYRDVRFSKNKEPYKIHFGAYIAPSGRKSKYGGYYIHIEPNNNSFVACGVHSPESTILKEIRYEIYNNADKFKQILDTPSFKKIFPKIYGEKLKTAPKGFPKDFKNIDLLNHKSYAVVHKLSNTFVKDEKNLIKRTIDICKIAYPLNLFLNKVIANTEQI